MIQMNAVMRSRLTNSLFSTTFFIAILTVAAPTLFPCPATQNPVGADSGDLRIDNDKILLARQHRRSQQQQDSTAAKPEDSQK
ncbi:uncharacterized protein V1518DRAFT_415214 [Limtongia smithiae]|uniref:uncharacterized protein n=1 Tax=Limtongia smithiae TaxID=1125753 RepID=UPI0034CDF420